MSIRHEPIVQQTAVAREVPVADDVVADTVVVAQPVAYQRPPAPYQTLRTSRRQRFAFDSFIVGLVGLALTVIGVIAVTRGGFDGPMNDPVVDVLGFTHTTTLGLIEAGIGLCLLISAVATSRAGAIFFGLVLGVAGIVGAIQSESFDDTLALESGLAWLAVVAGAVVVLASLLVPRLDTSTSRLETV